MIFLDISLLNIATVSILFANGLHLNEACQHEITELKTSFISLKIPLFLRQIAEIIDLD